MQASHGLQPVFDDRNLVSHAGLVPVLQLAERAALSELIGSCSTLPTANVAVKARTVLAGSGYWSQDSAVQVFGMAGTPKNLWVRWPGGKETLSSIPADAHEISVNPAGELKVIR